MSRFGATELLVIFIVIVVLFGYKKLPDIGRGLGQAMKNFKRSFDEPDEIDITETTDSSKKNSGSASTRKEKKKTG